MVVYGLNRRTEEYRKVSVVKEDPCKWSTGAVSVYHGKYLQGACPKSSKLITILPSSLALALPSKLGPISPATESISSRGKSEHHSDIFSSGGQGRVVSQLKLVEFCPLPKPKIS